MFKSKYLLVVLFTFFMEFSIANETTNLTEKFNDENAGVMVIAHRTCWRLAPENSIMGIEKCIELGVDMVEIDVRRTKDGHLVVIHDASVERTTNGEGLVKNLTLSEIRFLKLKANDGGETAKVTNHQVPTLQEMLLVAKDKILINLDAKSDIREQAYEEAKTHGMSKQVLIKMSITEPLKRILDKAFYQNALFMPIVYENEGVDNLSATVNNFNVEPQQAFEMVFKNQESLFNACVIAKNQGARCWVNTMWENLAPGFSDTRNLTAPDNYWGVLIRRGVNMIQTDRPQELLKYLSENNFNL